MTKTKRHDCPKCGEVLLPGATSCPECQWDVRAKQTKEDPPPDRQCQFRDGPQRCPLDGVFSHNTRGGGPWYCMEHAMNSQDDGKKILAAMIQNPRIVVALKNARRAAGIKIIISHRIAEQGPKTVAEAVIAEKRLAELLEKWRKEDITFEAD